MPQLSPSHPSAVVRARNIRRRHLPFVRYLPQAEVVTGCVDEVHGCHAQSFGKIEQPLVQDSAAAMLEVHEDITRDSRERCVFTIGDSS